MTFEDLYQFLLIGRKKGYTGAVCIYPENRQYPRYFMRCYMTKDQILLYEQKHMEVMKPKVLIKFLSNGKVTIQKSSDGMTLDNTGVIFERSSSVDGGDFNMYVDLWDDTTKDKIREIVTYLSNIAVEEREKIRNIEICTPDGFKELHNIKAGDMILGASGKPYKVIRIYDGDI